MKRNRQRSYKTTTTTDLNYSRIIKISIGVFIVLLIVYLATAISSGEIKFKKEKKKEVETVIQYQEIVAGTTFNRNASEYYVLLFNFTDDYASYYLSSIDSYLRTDNSLPFFIVDLEKKMNKDYAISEDDQTKYAYPKDLSTLKVKHPTLLKVKDGKTVDVVEGHEKISEFFDK